jgi:hypothetical protein
VILDDAFHYLRNRELAGNHCTTAFPGATLREVPASNGIAYTNGMTHSTNRTGHHMGNGTNGTKQVNGNKQVNGTNGFHRPQTNGTTPLKNDSRLLVLTAADEKALGRMVQGYEIFYKSLVKNDPVKVDRLAFTLAARRSHMLWRTFAIVNGRPENRRVGLSTAKPIRTSAEGGLAFIFTGQGAQYVKMGMDLLKYQVFERTLQQVDDIYARLGCEWSIFGEIYVFRKEKRD